MNTLRAFITALLLTSSIGPSWAGAGTITTKDASGVTKTFDVTTDGSGNFNANSVVCDQAAAATCASVGTAGSPSTNALTVQAVTLGHGTAANAMRVELPTDGTGLVNAAQSGTWNVTNISGTVSLPTGAATAALQGTNTATTAHTCSVAGYSQLGCLGQLDDDIKAALPAGTNQIGFVGLQSNTTGGCTPTRVLSAVSTNSTSVKGSAGTVCSITIIQNTATAADFRFYDSASAPTCSSATGVVANYGVQANTSSPGLSPNLGPFGLNFTTGIGFCLTAYDGTDTNNSNSVTGIQINIAYK